MSQLNLFQPEQTKAAPRPSLKSCKLIYEPNGRAREYATLACNVYRGCDHGCEYCYAPSATRRQREDFIAATTRGDRFLRDLERDAATYRAAGVTDPVLLSFTCDPYCHLDVDQQVTRRAIQILHAYGLPVQALTKGGSRALRDRLLFGPDDAFATTLTFLDDERSLEWEPHAAMPSNRIATIQRFHSADVPTWVSLEPVIDPATALEIIQCTHDFVDLYKIGKLNYEGRLPDHLRAQVEGIDWGQFAHSAISLLKNLGYARIHNPDDTRQANHKNRGFYVKDDLAVYLANTAT